MKVNKIICPIAVLAIATFASISNAQKTTTPAVDPVVSVVDAVAPELIVQEGASQIVGQTDGMVTSQEIVPAQPSFETISQPAFETTSEVVGSGSYLPSPAIQSCDCQQSSCTQCRPQRRACSCKRRGCKGDCKAPKFQSCEGDFCKLSIKKGKEKKTCFTTEQETICIPAVRLPWQDCCPPSKSRTRLVTRLKTEKQEVESCSYKWKVVETNDCGPEAPADKMPAEAKHTQQTVEGTVEAEPVAEPPAKPEVPKEVFEENVVPPAPKVTGAFLKAFRQR